MTIDLLSILAGATSQSAHQTAGWQEAIFTTYSSARIALFAASLAVFGLTFTAVSTLTRIKDKLYDNEKYQAMVQRLRAIDKSIGEYRSYEQLNTVFQLARWVALLNVAYHFTALIWVNWIFALGGLVAVVWMIAMVAWFAHLAHVHTAAITKLDQFQLDEQRREQAKGSIEQHAKPYLNLTV